MADHVEAVVGDFSDLMTNRANPIGQLLALVGTPPPGRQIDYRYLARRQGHIKVARSSSRTIGLT